MASRRSGVARRFAVGVLPGISLVAAAMFCWTYGAQPDALAAVTFWPAWFWPWPFLLLALPGWRRGRRWQGASALAAWAVFLGAFAEEPRTMWRAGSGLPADWTARRAAGRAVRVVSLNCAGGSADAAAEVVAFGPDIVLLQEAPRPGAVAALARRLYGSQGGWTAGIDCAILARGRVTALPVTRRQRAFMAAARVRLASGARFTVVSAHLTSPAICGDLHRPECWRAHADVRRLHREQAAAIARVADAAEPAEPAVVGGDMNASPRDGALRALAQRLQDAFGRAGRGWGNTITNETPVLRIDHVWLAPALKPVAARAHRTQHSDHRLVTCDLELPRRP